MNNKGQKITIWQRRQLYHRVRWLILWALLLLAALGVCHVSSPLQPATPQTDCRLVEHTAGITCVPKTIQRLVTLDETAFEYAVALGFHPVGTPLSDRGSSYLDNWLVGVENIGRTGEVNLERVLVLKPDLILGFDYYQRVYAQAAQIAPTVLLPFDHSGEWKTVFQRFGAALNREAIGQQIMDDYNRRLQTLQNRIKETADSTPTLPFPLRVSVVRIYPETINLYFRDSFCGTILQDAGLSRPVAQDLSALEAKQRFGNPIQASISVEQVEQVDGDVLFVWTSENTAAGNQVVQEKFAKLYASPLWQQLKVMKSNRVYFVPNYWIGSGPLAANAVIDDLFKYLILEQGV